METITNLYTEKQLSSSENITELQFLFSKSFFFAQWLKTHNIISESELINSDIDDDLPESLSQNNEWIKFRVWDENFSYALLKGIFSLGGIPKGLVVYNNKFDRNFFVKFQDENFDEVKTYFNKVLTLLNKEIHFKAYLSKKLKVEKSFEEELQSLKYA